MKKSRLGTKGSDIIYIFLLRMKLIGKDRITLTVLLSSLLMFSILIQTLSSTAEEHSAIPIGLVDLDNSEESLSFAERVSKVSSLRIVEETEEKLHSLLLDELIYAIFVIDEGFEEKLHKGNPKDLVSVYFIGKHRSTAILSDILAGEMMYPITLYKSIRYYEGIEYEGQKLSEDEYKSYIVQLLKGSTDFDFAFDISYERPQDSISDNLQISNTILYNQLIFGILGILAALIAMFIISVRIREKELGVEERLRISRFSMLQRDLGSVLSLLLIEGCLAFIFASLILLQLGIWKPLIIVSSLLLIMEFSLVMGCIFIIVSNLVKSIITYQMIGSILILITGGLGFYQMLNGFRPTATSKVLNFIPNCWFIQGFTDIIVYGNKQGILLKAHEMLAILAAVLIGLIISVGWVKKALKYCNS